MLSLNATFYLEMIAAPKMNFLRECRRSSLLVLSIGIGSVVVVYQVVFAPLYAPRTGAQPRTIRINSYYHIIYIRWAEGVFWRSARRYFTTHFLSVSSLPPELNHTRLLFWTEAHSHSEWIVLHQRLSFPLVCMSIRYSLS
jgi:hypothetical protein